MEELKSCKVTEVHIARINIVCAHLRRMHRDDVHLIGAYALKSKINRCKIIRKTDLRKLNSMYSKFCTWRENTVYESFVKTEVEISKYCGEGDLSLFTNWMKYYIIKLRDLLIAIGRMFW